ncbi:PBP1A family penicillin-binding protein [Aliiglaciecola sp. LCG003]|uniref:penicillin-binding protein 1A n=1 Tax=Aliiglaciecola sp. LCG003 TaxID=3053655 RepID=UPI0025729292|nr:PBP1A family penicillin-binding protein [Aliiglaciecola sp. LCG003]WJG10017.1 PBP1A family penicillin-binding protein [Aliiglaciecola sp. LCG003]
MKYIKLLIILSIAGILIATASIVGMYYYIKPDLPSVEVLKDVRLQTPMKIYTQDGQLISQFGVKRRIPLELKDVPQQLIHAVLATEDSRFYEHPGIDPIGMARALVNLIVTGERGQGGSTLTMQLARGFFLTREKTYIRKIKEMYIAWHMEGLLSKDEILELYLNKVELGHRAFGFGAAAQVYYGKSVQELTLDEIATIAGLPKAPSTLNPISSPERSKQRRRIVLLRMLDEGYITNEQFHEAADAPVEAELHGAEISFDAPYLADLIYNEMVELYGKEEAETGGYQVFATAPAKIQLAAQQAVVANIHDYDERHGYRGPIRTLWTEQESQDLSGGLDTVDNTPWQQEQLLDVLGTYNSIGELHPAVVTQVNEQTIDVLAENNESINIDWQGLHWARPYIDDNRQGPDPKVASDIVKSGQLIWIRKKADQSGWQLSQLPQVAGAFVALDPHNGAVRAVVGGYSFYQSQFNRATQAKRQVGSNIKPFIYSAAIEHGYTLASIINDAPINQWDASTGTAWRPQNSPAVYDGPIRMRVALGKSKNVVSVRLLRAIGIDAAVDHLTKFGFDRAEIPRDETLSLGSGSHTPLEVVTGMAVIANGGYFVQPHFIDRIEDEYGQVLWQSNPSVACELCELQESAATTVSGENEISNPADGELSGREIEALLAAELGGLSNDPDAKAVEQVLAERVIPAQNAFLVKEMMRTAVRGNGRWSKDPAKNTYWLGTGWRARNILGRTDLAGKTGTTNDSKDTWFSGFAPGLVATSWVGFDNMSRTLGKMSRNQNLINDNPEKFNWIGNAMIGTESGATAGQPAWIRFMQIVLEGVPEEAKPIPEGIVTVRIDRATGKLTTRTDYTSIFEYFIRGTEPESSVQKLPIIDPFETEENDEVVPEDIF